MDTKFYTYGYYHPITHELFYVGKGSGNRAYSHIQSSNLKFRKTYFANTINKIIRLYNVDPIIKILHSNLTETAALEIERRLIKKHGRKAHDKGGTLTNMSTGGESGRTGTKHSAESKLKMSKARRGKPHSPEHSANIARALRGTPLTEERKQKISKSLTGRKLSDEHKEKLKHMNHSNPTTTWKLLDPDGNIHVTSNLSEFCKKHNLSYTGIYKNRNKPIVRGKAKGWMTMSKAYSNSLNQLR